MKQSQKMPSRPQYSRDTQVLRSIEAHSALSVELSEAENLMSRLLLLSIQIDRKDHIIFELLQLTSKEDSQRTKQSLQKKCSAYQLQIKNLNDIVAMLKQNISSFEISKQREMFASVNNPFSQELESKVSQLQKQLRRTMEEKIDLQEQLKQIRLNQTLAEFNSFKNQHNQKGRVRELQTMLSGERARAQNDKKALFEKGQLIEELKKRVLEYQSREKMIVSQYEQKLRAYHSELIYTQNLKKSQIMTTQQRINAQAQQIVNLQEDNRAFKITNDQLKQTLSKKQNEISKLYNDYRSLESKMLRLQSENKQFSYKFQLKVEEVRVKDQEISETKIKLHKLASEIEEFRFNYATTVQEAQLYLNQNARIKAQSSRLESKIQEQRQQIRKIKRRPMSQDILCEGCKIRQSSSLITSQKSIKFFNISEIIEQTEQLFKSNRKIEQLINKVQLSEPSSIQMYQSRTVDM